MSTLSEFRMQRISKPLLKRVRSVLPPISATEREALEAGDVWWDAEILSGKPDWDKLDDLGSPSFSDAEEAFLVGPVESLCAMIDDWEITFGLRRIPDDIWRFLKENGFFGIIIPEEFGGLGFSAYAHSEIVTRISTCSTTVAVTVMVPNSLGPGELLMQFGTQEQKNHWLPRLASGQEIPCFGLTSPEAGSDAAAMTDVGIVCYRDAEGEDDGPNNRELGIRANWGKRYITLGPVATLMGLALKLEDPDHILGDTEDLGITVALVDTEAEGVSIGRRHYPCFQAFQNGPNTGTDVFIPMSSIIGGEEQVGKGWAMLMTALAAGRSISLPSLSAGGAKLAAYTTGAYSRVREQFGIPIGKFEGVQARLAKIAATAYTLDAARKVTTLALDNGIHPSVISAILKSQATYRLRETINDAMDVHGGKTVCDGPSNYLGNVYRCIPVAITVEGANILTRNLIIFGQGAIRCHPYLLREIRAAEEEDTEKGLEQFDAVVFKHIGFVVATTGRAIWHNLTMGRFAATLVKQGVVGPHYRQLSRYSASLTLATEVALLTLGGELKRKEMLSARLGDVLSEIYLLTCVLKRFEFEGEHSEDLPVVDWIFATGLQKIQSSLDEVMRNFPNRVLATLLRPMIFPFGRRERLPSDDLTRRCADLLMADSGTRERLTQNTVCAAPAAGIRSLQEAFQIVLQSESAWDKFKKSDCETFAAAMSAGAISESDRSMLKLRVQAVDKVIAVDDFSPEELCAN